MESENSKEKGKEKWWVIFESDDLELRRKIRIYCANNNINSMKEYVLRKMQEDAAKVK